MSGQCATSSPKKRPTIGTLAAISVASNNTARVYVVLCDWLDQQACDTHYDTMTRSGKNKREQEVDLLTWPA